MKDLKVISLIVHGSDSQKEDLPLTNTAIQGTKLYIRPLQHKVPAVANAFQAKSYLGHHGREIKNKLIFKLL